MIVPQSPGATRTGWRRTETPGRGLKLLQRRWAPLSTEAARVPASSYLSRSWLSCSDTTAFSRRRSLGPFLCNPLLQTPGDPRSTTGAVLPSPQRAMPHDGRAAPRRPRTRTHAPPPEERGVSDRVLGSNPNPPPREKVDASSQLIKDPLQRSDLSPGKSRRAGPRGHVTREGCAQA